MNTLKRIFLAGTGIAIIGIFSVAPVTRAQPATPSESATSYGPYSGASPGKTRWQRPSAAACGSWAGKSRGYRGRGWGGRGMGPYGFGRGNGYGRGMMGGYGPGMQPFFAREARRLGLTTEQREKIGDIWNKAMTQAWPIMGQLRQLRFHMHQSMRSSTVNEGEINQTYERMATLRRRLLDIRLEAREKTMKILTERQRKELENSFY